MNERTYLESYDPTQFDRPSLAVDVVLLTAVEGELCALLVRRDEHPDRGRWSLPGGFVGLDEALDAAAARVLREKAGLEGLFVEQLYTFGAPQRDPRTRVISVAYYALVAPERLAPLEISAIRESGMHCVRVPWEGEAGGPAEVVDEDGQGLPLAFDHADILGMAVQRIRGKLNYAPIGFQLLPSRFTLRRLQLVHETILGRALNKDAFRRRMLASGSIESSGERETEVGHRPAELYRFITPSAV